jgi:hypothetical protein
LNSFIIVLIVSSSNFHPQNPSCIPILMKIPLKNIFNSNPHTLIYSNPIENSPKNPDRFQPALIPPNPHVFQPALIPPNPHVFQPALIPPIPHVFHHCQILFHFIPHPSFYSLILYISCLKSTPITPFIEILTGYSLISSLFNNIKLFALLSNSIFLLIDLFYYLIYLILLLLLSKFILLH